MVNRKLTATICALVAAVAFPQEPFAGPGLIKASSTIVPAFMLSRPQRSVYLFGGMDAFVDEHVSFRGEGFWYMDSQEHDALLQENSQLTFGPAYHFQKRRFDASMGFTAGISLAQPRRVYADLAPVPLKAVPNIAASAGVTYYVWHYLHFFLTARWAHAQYPGLRTGTMGLDEVMLFGGLGWQVRLRKRK